MYRAKKNLSSSCEKIVLLVDALTVVMQMLWQYSFNHNKMRSSIGEQGAYLDEILHKVCHRPFLVGGDGHMTGCFFLGNSLMDCSARHKEYISDLAKSRCNST